AVELEATATGAVRAETNAFQPGNGANRDDVPDILRNDVTRKEIDLATAISGFASASAAKGEPIRILVKNRYRLHLDTGDTSRLAALDASIHHKIIASAIAVGFGDVEAAPQCRSDKTHLG